MEVREIMKVYENSGIQRRNRGIIGYMKRFWQMYKLVKWIDAEIDANDALTPEITVEDKGNSITTWGIIRKYSPISGMSHKVVQKLLWSCIENGYLKTHSVGDGITWVKMDMNKGGKLIYNRIGFIEEFLSQYGKITNVIFGIIIGLIPLLIYYLSVKKK